MKDIQAQISDAVIKRNISSNVRQISDTRYPVKFRYRQSRAKGSWFVVSHSSGKTHWRKVGEWPALNTRRLLERLPDIMAEIIINPDSPAVTAGRFDTTADLLGWYQQRMETARYLTKKRRVTIRCIIRKHLKPKLGKIKLRELTHSLVDENLVRVMQADYSVAYMRQVFDILRLAFKQAHKLRMIEANPIGGFQFGDFVDAQIKAREGHLKRNHLPGLFSRIAAEKYQQQMLVLMMLLHGTRIGETRQIRWDNIDWGDRMLLIPEEITKTRSEHRLPLTDVAIAILKRHRHTQEYHGYKGVYLFPTKRGTAISSGAASELIKNIGQGNWTAHDLRKLARTCWADLGIDYMVSEMLLNHKLTKLDQAYIHTYVETQKREALGKYHSWLGSVGLTDFLHKN